MLFVVVVGDVLVGLLAAADTLRAEAPTALAQVRALTVLYNCVGLMLAALGFLPPIFAAAAQSLPDLGILANSARLLRQK